MIQQAYFMDLNGSDNKCITDKELYVNSTGSSVFEEDFEGGHRFGRKDYHLLYHSYTRHHRCSSRDGKDNFYKLCKKV